MSKKIGFFNMTALWFGAAVSLSEMMTGGLLSSAGLKKGIAGILIGHLIGAVILAIGAYIGAKSKLAAMESTTNSFGVYGTKLLSLLNVVQLIGWTTVMIIMGARAFEEASKGVISISSSTVWILLIGLFVFIWIALGMDGLNYVNTAAVVLLFVMTIIMTINIFTSNTTLAAGQNPISIGAIIEFNVVMPLSWLPLAGDYTRFGKSIKGSTIGTFLGYFVGSSWMFIAGLAASLVTGDSDPTKLFTVMNLGIVALGIILLSTVTTTFMDAYSAGVSFVNITSKIKEKHAALIITVLATVLAFVFPMEQYEDFLYFIGSVFAPLFAIIFVDYFIFKKNFVDKNKKFKVDILALIVWALGVALYYGIKNKDIIIGITTPVMIVTSLIYGVARKVVSEAKTNYGKYEESI